MGTRKELSRHVTYVEARAWAKSRGYDLSTPEHQTPYQIRKHPTYYAVVERITKEVKAA